MITERAQIVAIAVLWVASAGSAMQSPPPRASVIGRQTAERRRVRDTVREFFTAWFEERNVEKTLTYFSASAFRNRFLLSSSCASYINDGNESEEGRRAGARKFLEDALASRQQSATSEGSIDSPLEEVRSQLKAFLINDPKVDPFVLVDIPRRQLLEQGEEESDYLLKKLPKEFYVCFISVGGGIAYFIWILDGGEWRIYHATLECQ